MTQIIFQAMISNGEKGEQVCRILLSTILGRPVGKVRVTAQKVLLGADTDALYREEPVCGG